MHGKEKEESSLVSFCLFPQLKKPNHLSIPAVVLKQECLETLNKTNNFNCTSRGMEIQSPSITGTTDTTEDVLESCNQLLQSRWGRELVFTRNANISFSCSPRVRNWMQGCFYTPLQQNCPCVITVEKGKNADAQLQTTNLMPLRSKHQWRNWILLQNRSKEKKVKPMKF